MTRAFDPKGERDIVFIPVGINYDRTLEDRSQVLALEAEAPRRGAGFAAATSLKFLLRNLLLMLQGRWYRFGYACVNFGSPLSMRSYSLEHDIDLRILPKEERFLEVEKAGGVADTPWDGGPGPPRLPGLDGPPALSKRVLQRTGLKAEALRVIEELSDAGAHIYIPRADQTTPSRWGCGCSPSGNSCRRKTGCTLPFRKSFPFSGTMPTHTPPVPGNDRQRLGASGRGNQLYTVYFGLWYSPRQ